MKSSSVFDITPAWALNCYNNSLSKWTPLKLPLLKASIYETNKDIDKVAQAVKKGRLR